MNFNSFSYILLFLPLVYCVVQIARRTTYYKAPQLVVLLASLLFYSFAKPSNLFYLVLSILVNWALAHWIANKTGLARKRVLQFGLTLNIFFLCSFKYTNFILSNIGGIQVKVHQFAPALALPLGISFFTLSQIMYLVDCYEDIIPPSSLFDHATFVSFFPYVISGPLSRTKRILHQFPALNDHTGPTAEPLARALYLFSLGLVKKVVLADVCSKAADYGFNNIAHLSALEAWCFATAYALQIYFDFSGYSDMAIATAHLFGIEIPRNFDSPLCASSIINYWQRWHISLTSFITTYIYTPIVRSFSRATLLVSAIATVLAMTIAGLWHGPNWTYVSFGAIHGVALAINQCWRKWKMPSIPAPISWLMTLVIFDTAFVFFRAPDLHTAILYIAQMINWHMPLGISAFRQMNGTGGMAFIFAAGQCSAVIAAFLCKNSEQMTKAFTPTRTNCAITATYLLMSLLYLNSNVAQPFIYFGF